ncbi:MAG: 50S ribosomal protein L4 [bacterium]|nr:50S ribosomal protein L4 [bacterium]
MLIKVHSIQGSQVGEEKLPDELFGIIPNYEVIAEAVRMYMANLRRGTASTLRRGEVSGGGKKPWPQKHTGWARSGSNRSPVWRGGGTVFGPHPRSYYYRLPKKKLALAFRSALSHKAKDNKILLVDKFELQEAKTRLFVEVLKSLSMDIKKSALFVVTEKDTNFCRAGQNINKVHFKNLKSLNTLDIVNSNTLVFSLNTLHSLLESHSSKDV